MRIQRLVDCFTVFDVYSSIHSKGNIASRLSGLNCCVPFPPSALHSHPPPVQCPLIRSG